MMRSKGSYFRTHSGELCNSVILPYRGTTSLKLLVILPHKCQFDEVEKDWLTHIPNSSDFSGEEIELSLPKTNFSQNASLREALQELGVVSVFSDSADFSPLFSPWRGSVEQVTHEAKIEINETERKLQLRLLCYAIQNRCIKTKKVCSRSSLFLLPSRAGNRSPFVCLLAGFLIPGRPNYSLISLLLGHFVKHLLYQQTKGNKLRHIVTRADSSKPNGSSL